jgi:hypothetical protein
MPSPRLGGVWKLTCQVMGRSVSGRGRIANAPGVQLRTGDLFREMGSGWK